MQITQSKYNRTLTKAYPPLLSSPLLSSPVFQKRKKHIFKGENYFHKREREKKKKKKKKRERENRPKERQSMQITASNR